MKRALSLVLVAGVAFLVGRFLRAPIPLAGAAGDPGAAGLAGGGAGTPSGNGDVNADGKINLTDAIYVLQYLFQGGPSPVPIEGPQSGRGALPATGQTSCHDADGNEIDCAGAEFYGQDGLYQAGCPRQGRFVDGGDETVTDKCTGLTWQKDVAPGDYTWQAALQYCEDLVLGGHGDWRLPNVQELQSIADYGRSGPSIDPTFETVPSNFWSSTTSISNPDQAWNVSFAVGSATPSSKTFGNYVRAVSDAPTTVR